MTLQVAIIADDLTGALDTGTPFVQAGLSVVVAIDVEALGKALQRSPEVVVVNTASRALAPAVAAAKVEAVLAAFGVAKPDIIFKKIDSRLKGNVAAESIALAMATGRSTILVAPAVPDQQRFTVAGAVTGRGVETPLPIRPLFLDTSLSIDIRDACTDAELDDLVGDTDWRSVIAVGARGLGSALARSLARSVARPLAGSRSSLVFSPSRETLFAFGSRDPITTAQIEQLCREREIAAVIDALAGEMQDLPSVESLPAVARCSGELTTQSESVARRFAAGIRSTVEATRPKMLMMGGGDTAFAILRALGVAVVVPNGEIEAGIPWFEIESADGRILCCAVKSGGFGNRDSLLKFVPRIGSPDDVQQDRN